MSNVGLQFERQEDISPGRLNELIDQVNTAIKTLRDRLDSYKQSVDVQITGSMVGLKDNAGSSISPDSAGEVQLTDDGKINADKSGGTIDLSIADDQIDHDSTGNVHQDVNTTASPEFVTLNLSSVKSGATQVAAGASAGELWVTSSHASLPDNVIMIGV